MSEFVFPMIKNKEDLLRNIAIFDLYTEDPSLIEYKFAIDLLKESKHFVVLPTVYDYKFYPAIFVGYLHNSMQQHNKNIFKDGREVYPGITRILGRKKASPDSKLNKIFLNYCSNFGIEVREKLLFGVERKFWLLS